jgi:flavoprotein
MVLSESSKKINGVVNPHKVKTSVIAIVTGGNTKAKEAFYCVRNLKEKGYYITLLATPCAVKIHGYENLCLQTDADRVICDDNILLTSKLLENHRHIIIPILTSNSCAKIATGMWDTLATYLVYQALVSGLNVVAAKDSAFSSKLQESYNNPIKKILTKNPFEKIIERNLKTLEELGINVVNLSNLCESFPPIQHQAFTDDTTTTPDNSGVTKVQNQSKLQGIEKIINKKVITKDDILELKDKVNTLVVEKSSIITPLAKDFARSIGIQIISK